MAIRMWLSQDKAIESSIICPMSIFSSNMYASYITNKGINLMLVPIPLEHLIPSIICIVMNPLS